MLQSVSLDAGHRMSSLAASCYHKLSLILSEDVFSVHLSQGFYWELFYLQRFPTLQNKRGTL